jgi:hypothetical protein
MLRREENPHVEIPSVDYSDPGALLDVRGGLAFPAVVDSEAGESWRPGDAGRESWEPSARRLCPHEDSVTRKLLEAAEERDGSDRGHVQSGDSDNQSWIGCALPPLETIHPGAGRKPGRGRFEAEVIVAAVPIATAATTMIANPLRLMSRRLRIL